MDVQSPPIHRLNNPSPAVDVKNLGDSQLLTENGKNSEIMLNPDWTKAVPLVCRKKTCKTHGKLRESPPFAQTWCRFPGRYRARPSTQPEFAAGHQHFFWRIIVTDLILEGKSKDVQQILGICWSQSVEAFHQPILQATWQQWTAWTLAVARSSFTVPSSWLKLTLWSFLTQLLV